MADDINVLAMVKGEERYIFLYDDGNRSNALRVLGRYASNTDLSFSWYDAAVLSQKIRKQHQDPESQTEETTRFRLPAPSDECHDVIPYDTARPARKQDVTLMEGAFGLLFSLATCGSPTSRLFEPT